MNGFGLPELEPFDAHQDFKTWIRRFEIYCMFRKWNGETRRLALPLCMANDILAIYLQLPEIILDSYELTRGSLMDIFDPSANGAPIESKAVHLTRLECESTYNYANRLCTHLCRLFTLAGVREIETVVCALLIAAMGPTERHYIERKGIWKLSELIGHLSPTDSWTREKKTTFWEAFDQHPYPFDHTYHDQSTSPVRGSPPHLSDVSSDTAPNSPAFPAPQPSQQRIDPIQFLPDDFNPYIPNTYPDPSWHPPENLNNHDPAMTSSPSELRDPRRGGLLHAARTTINVVPLPVLMDWRPTGPT